jgi:hypothetical protein
VIRIILVLIAWWLLVGLAVHFAYRYNDDKEIGVTLPLALIFGPFTGFLIYWKQREKILKENPPKKAESLSRAERLRQRNSLDEEGKPPNLLRRLFRR